MRFRGLRLEDGSWNTIAVLPPEILEILCIRRVQTDRCLENAHRHRFAFFSRFGVAVRPRVDFPHPDSPTTPRISPASTVKETTVDRFDDGVRSHIEVGFEVFYA
jgi:hypothetical protein